MWLFERLFGRRGESSKARTEEKTIQRIRDTEKMLKAKREGLTKRIEQELLTAKKNGTKNKRAALRALRRKHRSEKQLEQIDRTLWNLELQREELENPDITLQVIKMNIDKVYDVMDMITEQQEMAKEIADVISRPTDFEEDCDELTMDAISDADVQEFDGDETELQKKLNGALEMYKQLLEKGQQREDRMQEIVDSMLWLEKKMTDASQTYPQQQRISSDSDDKEKHQLDGEAEDPQTQLDEKNRPAGLELQLRLLQTFMTNHHEKIQEKFEALERELKITKQDLQDERENCSYLMKQLKTLKQTTRKSIRITEQPAFL